MMTDDELANQQRIAAKALQEVTDGVAEMEIEIQRLRKERDEWREDAEWERRVSDSLREERDAARREVCLWVNTDASGCVKSGSEETAIERGWDCFKNQETQ